MRSTIRLYWDRSCCDFNQPLVFLPCRRYFKSVRSNRLDDWLRVSTITTFDSVLGLKTADYLPWAGFQDSCFLICVTSRTKRHVMGVPLQPTYDASRRARALATSENDFAQWRPPRKKKPKKSRGKRLVVSQPVGLRQHTSGKLSRNLLNAHPQLSAISLIDMGVSSSRLVLFASSDEQTV